MNEQPIDLRAAFLEKLRSYVAAYITRQRKDGNKVTQATIAQEIGPYDRVAFNRWLHGHNSMPPHVLERLCKLLSLSDEQQHELLSLGGYIPRAARPQPASTGQGSPDTLLRNAPPRPRLMLGRDKDAIAIKTRLGVGGRTGRSTQVLTAMKGWPGVGKTTLASALAYDPEIAQAFPDGVLWATLGQQPNVARELTTWGRLLGIADLHHAPTLEEMSGRLRQALQARRCLLIVDDAWQAEHVPFFDVGGPGCALLVTTRRPEVARAITPRPSDVYTLGVLSEADALDLLRVLAPAVVAQNEATCRELVRDLEGLPLALQVAGRLLQTEASYGFGVTDLLAEIREGARLIEAQAPLDRAEIAQETTPTVAALLKKSTDMLDPHTLDCFAYLAPFASKPATFDLKAMQAVWEVADPKPTVRSLVDHGLLEPVEGERFWMHAILVVHARSFLPEE